MILLEISVVFMMKLAIFDVSYQMHQSDEKHKSTRFFLMKTLD